MLLLLSDVPPAQAIAANGSAVVGYTNGHAEAAGGTAAVSSSCTPLSAHLIFVVLVAVLVVVANVILLIVVLVIVLVILVRLASVPAHCVGYQLTPEGRPAQAMLISTSGTDVSVA